MLSFIYRIAAEFKQQHGVPPNLLYLNPRHLQRLLDEFEAENDFEFITRFLGMDILVFPGHPHPQVAWKDHATAIPGSGIR